MFLALAGCAGPARLPSGVDAADLAAFRAAVAAAGCVVADAPAALEVENGTGFTPVRLRAIAEYLAGTGELAPVAGGGFLMATGACGRAEVDPRRGQG